jgi:predicted short-subunit dehydrogenase-like oxidoreductase (DUF2520 family)
MTSKRSTAIAIVGAGSLGSALAVSLRGAGYRVPQIVSRPAAASRRRARRLAKIVQARVAVIDSFDNDVDLVWLCVPDRAIRNCARFLARRGDWKGKFVFHSSGALGSTELVSLERRGAKVASVHPMMTFVAGEPPVLKGVPFAVEGDAAAVRLAKRITRNLGGQPFSIQRNRKVAYHTWGSFASPLLISLLAATERVAGEAGVSRSSARKRMLPILRQTLANYLSYGAARAFSGPIIRGDAATVEKHLTTLRVIPDVKRVYMALARSALQDLPARNKKELLRILD